MPRFDFSLPDGSLSVLHWLGAKSGGRPDGTKPVLHWAHANGFNGQTYHQLLSSLADEIDIFAADARGHGFSDLPAEPKEMTGWHIYRNDLEPLIAMLAVHAGQKIWLGGHSMGGCASIMLAAKRPDLVAGLVLSDPVIVADIGRWLMPVLRLVNPNNRGFQLLRMASRRRRDWPDRATAEAAYRGRGAFKSWQAGFLADYLAGGLRPKDGQMSLCCAPLWEAANFKGPQIDSVTPVKKLRVPFTLLMAQFGSTTRVPKAFDIPKVDKKIEIVPGTTHFLPMEQPEKLRTDIRLRLGLA